MTSAARRSRILVLGTGAFARALAEEIESRPACGYEVIGLVGETAESDKQSPGFPQLGTLEQFQDTLLEQQPDRIVDALLRPHEYSCQHKLMEAKYCRDIMVEDGETLYERLTGKLAIEALTPDVVLYTDDFQPAAGTLHMNRALSLVFSLVGIIFLAPILMVLAVAIKLDSRGPVLFVQKRMGAACKPFMLLKFRTMHPTSRPVSEWAGDNDHRITRVGHFLRRFRLDELPQFINVLKGDMNIVGPRPHPASNYELFFLVSRNIPVCGGQIPYYLLRSKVRPGITGWAQVRYQYANNLKEEIEKMRFDLYYVKHYSTLLDIRILWETVLTVIMGREVAAHGTEAVVNDDSGGP